MYPDYYSILGVDQSATPNMIIKAYRVQAKKWHPDINQHDDATEKMQLLVEAYMILKDPEARARYDIMYNTYFNNADMGEDSLQNPPNPRITDEVLDEWIRKARAQAVDFVSNSIRDIKGVTASGCRYTFIALGISTLIALGILALIFLSILFGN